MPPTAMHEENACVIGCQAGDPVGRGRGRDPTNVQWAQGPGARGPPLRKHLAPELSSAQAEDSNSASREGAGMVFRAQGSELDPNAFFCKAFV